MLTPQKITRAEMKTRMEDFFQKDCYQGPHKLWRHQCGTLIHVLPVSLSIHNTLFEEQCGGSGRVELQTVPFCPRCEPDPESSGCLHDPNEKPIPVVIVPELTAPILVWRFAEAPEEYRKLSPHGGNEDWLALVPPSFKPIGIPAWMGRDTEFGICSLSEHPLLGGFLIVIGAHS